MGGAVNSIHNPFTPKSGIEPRFFIGREGEIKFFKQALKDTEAGRPSHFIVLGDWGSGKTSLLKEFKNIAQKEGSLCSLVSVRDFEGEKSLRDGINYLVEEIALRLPLDVSRFHKFAGDLTQVGVTVAGTGFHFSKEIVRGDPQPFFYSNMLNLWSDLRNETKVLVVLLDDIQYLSSISAIMSIIRNTLAEEKIVKEVKLLFVLASTFHGWKPFLQRNHPIGRYFTPRMKLTNLSESETYKFIEDYLEHSGVSFSKEVMKQVYHYTEGHLYEVHVLCNHLFNNQIKGRVTPKVFESALERTLDTLGEEVFDDLFESAGSTEQLVLSVLAENKGNQSFHEVFSIAQKRYALQKNVVAVNLERLVKKRVVKKLRRATYSVDDTLFRTYIIQRMAEVNEVNK